MQVVGDHDLQHVGATTAVAVIGLSGGWVRPIGHRMVTEWSQQGDIRRHERSATPSVARYAGLEGPSDQFDMSGAEEFGYNRVEAARRRIAEAVRDFEDEVPRP